jgi:hypothetical protein
VLAGVAITVPLKNICGRSASRKPSLRSKGRHPDCHSPKPGPRRLSGQPSARPAAGGSA